MNCEQVLAVVPSSISAQAPEGVWCAYHSPGIQGSARLPYRDLSVTVALVHRSHYRRVIATLGILQDAAIEGMHTHAHTHVHTHTHAHTCTDKELQRVD